MSQPLNKKEVNALVLKAFAKFVVAFLLAWVGFNIQLYFDTDSHFITWTLSILVTSFYGNAITNFWKAARMRVTPNPEGRLSVAQVVTFVAIVFICGVLLFTTSSIAANIISSRPTQEVSKSLGLTILGLLLAFIPFLGPGAAGLMLGVFVRNQLEAAGWNILVTGGLAIMTCVVSASAWLYLNIIIGPKVYVMLMG